MPRERTEAQKGRAAHARGGNQHLFEAVAGPPACWPCSCSSSPMRLHKEDGEEFAAAAPGATPLPIPRPRPFERTHFAHRLRAQEEGYRVYVLSTGL